MSEQISHIISYRMNFRKKVLRGRLGRQRLLSSFYKWGNQGFRVSEFSKDTLYWVAEPGHLIPNLVCFSHNAPLPLRWRIYSECWCLEGNNYLGTDYSFCRFLYLYFFSILLLWLTTFALVERSGIPLSRYSGKGFVRQRGQKLMVKMRFVEPVFLNILHGSE